MRISKISEVTPSTTAWAPVRSPLKPATAPSSPSANPADPSNSSVQIRRAASTSQIATLAASYSTTVGGKNYSGSVEEFGGTYVASVPNPPAISASGSSVQSAESNLNIALDALA